MRAHWMMVALLPFALVGCDSDGDGLSNKEEADLGTNPDVADTDGDGLNDYEEVNLNLDPLDDDSDDDGFSDGDEIADDTDPTNPMSYVRSTDGTWPDLTKYVDDSTPTGWGVGDRFKRYTLTDQYGNEVDTYQFWGNVVLADFSAGWCGPCRTVARTAEDEYRAHADEGFIIIHFMTDDNSRDGTLSDPEFTKSWANDFALTFPVFNFDPHWDEAGSGMGSKGLYTGGIPFMVLLDKEMKIVTAASGSGAEKGLIEEAAKLLAE